MNCWAEWTGRYPNQRDHSTAPRLQPEFAGPCPTHLDARRLEKTIELVRFHGQMKAVEFSLNGDAVPAMIDANRMIQVLTNLFLNAGAAMDGSGTINLTLKSVNESVQIDVVDTGPGVPGEDFERIFDPFWTSKPTGMGTGSVYGSLRDSFMNTAVSCSCCLRTMALIFD